MDDQAQTVAALREIAEALNNVARAIDEHATPAVETHDIAVNLCDGLGSIADAIRSTIKP